MKDSIKHLKYTDWLSSLSKDFPEFDEVLAVAKNADPKDLEDEMINAAGDLQRVAWLTGFDYATNLFRGR